MPGGNGEHPGTPSLRKHACHPRNHPSPPSPRAAPSRPVGSGAAHPFVKWGAFCRCRQVPRPEPALSGSGHLESPACKKGWVCSGRSPACSPDGILAAAPAQCRACPSGGEGAADVSVGPQHQPQPRLAAGLGLEPGQGAAVWYLPWGVDGHFLCQCGPSSSCRSLSRCPGGPALLLDGAALRCFQAAPVIAGLLGRGGPASL